MATTGKPVKPNPYTIYEILEQTKPTNPKLFISAIPQGYADGQECQTLNIGVQGFRPKEELLQYGADVLLKLLMSY